MIPGRPPSPVALPPGCRFAPRCRYATDRCRTEEPQLTENEAGHAFRCFHPVDVAVAHPGADGATGGAPTDEVTV